MTTAQRMSAAAEGPRRKKTALQVLTLGMGVLYGLIGVFVGLGALFPKPGWVFLNVEDADEILEQRRLLGWSAVGCLAIALPAIALVLASPRLAVLSSSTAAALFVAGTIVAAATGRMSRQHVDEFGRRLSTDSNGGFAMLVCLVFGSWAAFAHLGHMPMFTALGFYGGILGLYLLAIFAVVARRSLMLPRG